MSSEMFHLEWDHFRENLISSIENFKEKDFTDVILACEDRQVMSHKLVLAASSPLFHEMLVKHPHPQPLLFLKGVKYLDLKALLCFMYSGEVELEQARLDSFLQLGQELQVKGLTKEETIPQSLTSISAIREDSDIKWSVNKKQKVKGITWFPENFQVNRMPRLPEYRKGSDCQEMFVMQGSKTQMGHQSTSSSSTLSSCNDSGTYSSMVTSKKTPEPEGESCPNICTQGTLQQVLKGLSKSKQRLVPADTPSNSSSEAEHGNWGLDCVSSDGSLQPRNVQSLNDEKVRFPEFYCSENLSDGENSNMQIKSIHAPEQCYPGNFPDYVEESKDVDKNKSTFRCKLCKKTKFHRSGLVEHIESVHFPGTFIHSCKFCDKTVKTKSALNSHLHSCKNRFFQVNNNNNTNTKNKS